MHLRAPLLSVPSLLRLSDLVPPCLPSREPAPAASSYSCQPALAASPDPVQVLRQRDVVQAGPPLQAAQQPPPAGPYCSWYSGSAQPPPRASPSLHTRPPLPALSLPLLASAPRPPLRRRLSSPTPPLAPVPAALPAPRRSARRRKATSARKGGSRRRGAPALAASRSTARGEVDAACCTPAGEETPLRLCSRRIHAPAAPFRSTHTADPPSTLPRASL